MTKKMICHLFCSPGLKEGREPKPQDERIWSSGWTKLQKDIHGHVNQTWSVTESV